VTDTRVPGHWKEGDPDGTNHFESAQCTECDSHRYRRLTLDQADDFYRTGRMSQDWFEAYMHVWATSAHRYSGLHAGWTQPPESPAVIERTDLLRALLAVQP